VIAVIDDRVFRALSTAQLQRLLDRAAESARTVRLLDSTWEWFELMSEVGVIAPSFLDRLPPTKASLVALVNGRSNRDSGSTEYNPRSLSNRTREEVFAELLAVLPVR
jgi:hypothetical protein